MQALDLASFQAFPPSSFDQTRLAQTYMHDATILSIMSWNLGLGNIYAHIAWWWLNLHLKAGSVSSLHLNVSAGPVPANSTVAMSPLTVTPPLIKWVVQKEGSELISNLLLSIALSSLLLMAATRSTYFPGARSVNDTFPEEPEGWWWGGEVNTVSVLSNYVWTTADICLRVLG